MCISTYGILKVGHLQEFDLGDFCMIHDHISCLYALPVGTGCIVKCVSFAIGREPTVVGKPYKPMLDVIKSR